MGPWACALFINSPGNSDIYTQLVEKYACLKVILEQVRGSEPGHEMPRTEFMDQE